MPSKDPLTRFGAAVLELMIRRNVRTWRELAALLSRRGYAFGAGSFSGWAYGRHATPKTLPLALAEVLELDPDERARLADAFAYGQDEPITLPDLSE